jgi:hypothetical protein
MFQTLLNVQDGEAVGLQQCVDNSKSDRRVGLRSLTWWVGWFNWEGGKAMLWRRRNSANPSSCLIPAGLYSERQVTESITASFSGLQIAVGEHDGVVNFTVPAGYEVRLSDHLRQLYGLDDRGWLDPGQYTGDRPVNFLPSKTVGVRLHQLNTTSNVVNGAPSNVLTYLPVHCLNFGKVWSINFDRPEMKLLQGGAITELKIELVDSYGQKINNNGLPVHVTLEIA